VLLCIFRSIPKECRKNYNRNIGVDLKGYYQITSFFEYLSLLLSLAKPLMGLMKNINKHYGMNETFNFEFFQCSCQGVHSPESLVLLVSF
jgi:hypothetical protein